MFIDRSHPSTYESDEVSTYTFMLGTYVVLYRLESVSSTYCDVPRGVLISYQISGLWVLLITEWVVKYDTYLLWVYMIHTDFSNYRPLTLVREYILSLDHMKQER